MAAIRAGKTLLHKLGMRTRHRRSSIVAQTTKTDGPTNDTSHDTTKPEQHAVSTEELPIVQTETKAINSPSVYSELDGPIDPVATESNTKTHDVPGENSNESNETQTEGEVQIAEPISCVICLSECINPKQLDKCGHTFCTECINYHFEKSKPQCPCCFTIYGEIRGDQPGDGEMFHMLTKHRLPGYEQDSKGTIEIYYQFADGVQNENHPHPGQPYSGTVRRAYLPNNAEGRHVLQLLERAFALRLIFTIGQSHVSGKDNVITWNDIHHKTSYKGGPANFGYPDPTYLNRVQQELASKGIS